MTRVLLSGRVYEKQVGGNTRYVRNVYGRLREYGVSFDVAAAPRHLDGAARSVAYAGLEGIWWPRVANDRFDVIHFPADTGSLVASRKPVVGTIHGLATLHVPGVRGSAADNLWRARVKRLAALSDRIITVSESSADDIAHFAPDTQQRIEVIHHGIDHETFNDQIRHDITSVTTEFGIPEQYFLYVGNLDPRKNILNLLTAAAEVYQIAGIPLVVSGAPAWDSENIMAALRNTPGVIYAGRVDDSSMIGLLQNAVAFCFPSSYEGFGFPVLEAMACGAPVICSDRGSLKEVAGGAAHLLEHIDSESIRDAMIELARDQQARANLTRLGKSNAGRFQWSESARRHAEVFAEVAS